MTWAHRLPAGAGASVVRRLWALSYRPSLQTRQAFDRRSRHVKGGCSAPTGQQLPGAHDSGQCYHLCSLRNSSHPPPGHDPRPRRHAFATVAFWVSQDRATVPPDRPLPRFSARRSGHSFPAPTDATASITWPPSVPLTQAEGQPWARISVVTLGEGDVGNCSEHFTFLLIWPHLASRGPAEGPPATCKPTSSGKAEPALLRRSPWQLCGCLRWVASSIALGLSFSL